MKKTLLTGWILMGITLALYVVIQIGHIQMNGAYGSCRNGICIDKLRTNHLAVGLYAIMGATFIGSVVTLIAGSVVKLFRNSSQSKRKK